MKYIFVAGAPGSKWSSVVKNIYYSPSIDRSDYRDEWTYYHDASGRRELMHLGAYWDPGMACDLPADLSTLTKQQLEDRFNEPFNKDSAGIRIIKSHIFCYEKNIQYLRQQFVDCAIVLVHRSSDSCLGWWVKCGHFDITYPSYAQHYKDLRTMSHIIAEQNRDIEQVMYDYNGVEPLSNRALAQQLGLEPPPLQYAQNYAVSDIKVKVI